ncbi:hypothetical protein CARUB_v10022380mg [Capsella rubella]|uniref:Knottin scorpion toxin-like domain-containing protein n=1 Tax=Capsella rubella TaxID=81985 RepID=R0IDN8_9BRAS|nr:defensin-like protein 90 [Capsella rubella]EOA34803.1 hypothetical protein CARUB_v10022380mg [Capsella rubella]
MATKKILYVLLLSLMMFGLIHLPMISGQSYYYQCKHDGCTSTPKCYNQCLSMGYPLGGECRIYSYGGDCCCRRTSKPP